MSDEERETLQKALDAVQMKIGVTKVKIAEIDLQIARLKSVAIGLQNTIRITAHESRT